MKIALVHNEYQQPGGEDIVFEQEKRILERAGHQVVTYKRSNHEIEELSAIGRGALVVRTVWAGDTHHDFAALLEREKPDVVHVHNTFVMISPSIYSACRKQGIPVVQTLHNFRLLCPGAQFLRDGNICEDCVEHSLLRSVWHGCYRDSRPATASAIRSARLPGLLLGSRRYIRTSRRAFLWLSEFIPKFRLSFYLC